MLACFETHDGGYWDKTVIGDGIRDFCAAGVRDVVKIWAITSDGSLCYLPIHSSGMMPLNPLDAGMRERCARVEVSRRPENRCEVFVLTEDGALHGKIQLEKDSKKHPDGVWSGWTWIDTYGEVFRDLHVSYNADEHIELFFMTSDNKIRNYFYSVWRVERPLDSGYRKHPGYFSRNMYQRLLRAVCIIYRRQNKMHAAYKQKQRMQCSMALS